MRTDLELISRWIPENASVLDLGCGEGELLAYLQDVKNVTGYGVEIDNDQIVTAISRGINCVRKDLNHGLESFTDDSMDIVMMTQSLQQLDEPDVILKQLLRVGKEAIVTFPNFGHWTTRRYLGFKGQMPVSKALPYQWFDTPNIHLCTFKDFERLCKEQGITIKKRLVVDRAHKASKLINLMPNLMGEIAIYHIGK